MNYRKHRQLSKTRRAIHAQNEKLRRSKSLKKWKQKFWFLNNIIFKLKFSQEFQTIYLIVEGRMVNFKTSRLKLSSEKKSLWGHHQENHYMHCGSPRRGKEKRRSQWQIHVNEWQNQYNIVSKKEKEKKKKMKLSKKKKKKSLFKRKQWLKGPQIWGGNGHPGPWNLTTQIGWT